MTGLQRFFLAVVPRNIGKAMEKESRLWIMRCTGCGNAISVWDAGGIRYLAIGKKWRWRRCGNCDHRTWHEVVKR